MTMMASLNGAQRANAGKVGTTPPGGGGAAAAVGTLGGKHKRSLALSNAQESSSTSLQATGSGMSLLSMI